MGVSRKLSVDRRHESLPKLKIKLASKWNRNEWLAANFRTTL
jgi:hypothetical protein